VLEAVAVLAAQVAMEHQQTVEMALLAFLHLSQALL
jgi:hypothetical protein